MKKNGFTLVELLAVIAILAILVIVALPNVMGMFNEAKKNSFTTEVKQIYKTAQQEWISDSMFSTSEQTYSRCKTCTGKSLNLTGRSELEYYIKINKAGDVVKYYVTDGSYQYSFNSGKLLIEDIENIKQISELEDDEIIQITSGGIVNEPVNLITFTVVNIDYNYQENTKTYQAVEGMTWQEWLNSEYNTDGIDYVDGGWDCGLMDYILQDVEYWPNDSHIVRYNNVIIAGKTYYREYFGECQ